MTKQWYDVLREVRENLGYSQQEVVEMLKIGRATYSRWERGLAVPIPAYRRLLCKVLELRMDEIGFPTGHNDTPSAIIKLKDASYDREGMHKALQGDLGQRLLSIVDAGTYTDQCEQFALVIEQFDAMNTDNPIYEMTRRQAVRNLAVFPFAPPINLEQRDRVSSSHYELFLRECGASLTACDELGWSSHSEDVALAFRAVSRYLKELLDICNSSSRYRQQALELAALCAIKKKTLGYACASKSANTLFAQDAVDIARESGNVRLLLSAYKKQTRDYFTNNQKELALETAMTARGLLEALKERLPACIRGGIYSALAIMKALNGLDADTAIKKASEEDPGDQDLYEMLYTRVWVPIDQGTAYFYEDPGKALKAYAQIVDPETLAATKPFQETLPEILRVKTVLGMARASMKGNARDKGNAIRYWKEAIEGAKRLKHKSLYSEIVIAHDLLDAAFPDEQVIYNLRDHMRNVDKSLTR